MAQESKQQPVRQKKIPMRQCLGCNEHRPKRELLRVVRDPQGEVSLDFTGKKSGRGAYICRDVKCLRRVRKNGRLSRSLECEISDEVYAQMEEDIAVYEKELSGDED